MELEGRSSRSGVVFLSVLDIVGFGFGQCGFLVISDSSSVVMEFM